MLIRFLVTLGMVILMYTFVRDHINPFTLSSQNEYHLVIGSKRLEDLISTFRLEESGI